MNALLVGMRAFGVSSHVDIIVLYTSDGKWKLVSELQKWEINSYNDESTTQLI